MSETLTANQNPSEFTGCHQLDFREIFLQDIVAGVMMILVSNWSRPLLCEKIQEALCNL